MIWKEMTDSSPGEAYEHFFVPGHPLSGGSKTAFVKTDKLGRTKPRVTDANPRVKKWKRTVSVVATKAYEGKEMLVGPVGAWAVFFMPRPKSHYRTGKYKNLIKDSKKHLENTSKPDLTKLWRPVEDALTGIVWKDDSQVCLSCLRKCYPKTDRIGVWICVVELES